MDPEPPASQSLHVLAGAVGLIVGLVWMIRLARTNLEDGESSWRYRDRHRRLDRARWLIRAELAIAIAVPLVAGFLLLVAPTWSPMFEREPTLLGSILPWAGVAMYLVGLGWMIHLSRVDPDARESAWRYRDRQRRLDRARWLIRTELTLAIAVALVAGLLFVAAPQSIGPMFALEPTPFESILPWFGSAVYIVGLVWMIRLSRTNPEDGESAWRYRDF